MEKSTRAGSSGTPRRTTGKPAPKKRSALSIALGLVGRLIGLVLMALILAGCVVGGMFGGGIWGIIQSSKPIDPESLKVQTFNSFVYDVEGNVIAELKRDENRVWIDYPDIPKTLIDAYVAIEDKRFFEHDGVDYKGVMGAFVQYAKKFVDPDVDVRGASTLTQQLIKNLTGNDDTTVRRKLQEQWQAVQLEKGLTKEEILTLYMNTVPMGGTFYGIETAAKGYFGKDVRNLTLSEYASLAGITNWTVKYMPSSAANIKANLVRRDLILDEMFAQGKIKEFEYKAAKAEKIAFQYNPQAGAVTKTSTQSYFVDEAIRSVKLALIEQFGYSEQTALDMIYNTGMQIHTTLNPEIQAAMDAVFLKPDYFVDNSKETDELPQAAMVIIDPKSGQVQALYGGRGEKQGSVFNRATQARRSPGSSIKPIVVYAPGIESKTITAATVVDDVPQYLNGEAAGKQWPTNVEEGNFGLTGVREGITKSRNVVATLLLVNHVGYDNALDYLAKVGIDRREERYASIAMGGFNKGITPLEMCAAYTPFANKGVYTAPIFYTSVTDYSGKTILDGTPKRSQVYSEETTFIMDSLLTDVVRSGTANPYGTLSYKRQVEGKEKTVIIPTAGKTGTTDDSRDKWFCGFSDYYVGTVWYGFDDQSVSVPKVDYSNALKIWNEVMTKVHEELEPRNFYDEVPANLVSVAVCRESGLRPNEFCASDPRGSQVYAEYFIKGTEPGVESVCGVHVSATVCSGATDELGRALLATPFCPAETVSTGVFIHRPIPYTKTTPNEKPPADIKYEFAEGELCTVHTSAPVVTPPATDGTGTEPGTDKPATPDGGTPSTPDGTGTTPDGTQLTDDGSIPFDQTPPPADTGTAGG